MFENKSGEIIYVGKAASLKRRVNSYFQSDKHQPPKVRVMMQQVTDLQYIVTDSEVEALILECNLIKEHRPKYNVNLKDDKHYPYLKITLGEEFPRIMVTRSMQKDGSRYFGPYTRAGAMRETLKLLRSLFPVRTCKKVDPREQSRPCLNAHIKRCLAPCSGRVKPEEYGQVIREVILFLEGRQDDLIRDLEERMRQAAANLEFEKAAELRDQIAAIKEVLAHQKIVSDRQEDQDVLALARGRDKTCGQIFFIRGGKVVGRDYFWLTSSPEETEKDIMTAFLKQYYSKVDFVPQEVILQVDVEDKEVIEEWLRRKRGKKVNLIVPRRGKKRQLVEMVAENARLTLEEAEKAAQQQLKKTQEALRNLQKVLDLPRPPERIECYDISNFQGHAAVGSMVVFENGQPKNSDYRRFRIKGVQGPNDFACLQEVLERRFRRATNSAEDTSFSRLPDVIIIDGGKGQLTAALEVLERLGIKDIPVFALAKEEELIFRQGSSSPVKLPRDSSALHILQHIRDEAHRFAITYHRKLHRKESYGSILDEIPGIGPKRKRALLAHFGSVAHMRKATKEELAAVEGMNNRLADRVYRYLQGLK